MGAELAARRTAAAAALADFNAQPVEDEQWTTWAIWAERLAHHLQSLLGGLDTEQPEPSAPHRSDVLNYEHFDCCGQGMVPKPGPLEQLGAEAVARQVEQIRLVLVAFDWEHDDRQYALEQIDDILRGER